MCVHIHIYVCACHEFNTYENVYIYHCVLVSQAAAALAAMKADENVSKTDVALMAKLIAKPPRRATQPISDRGLVVGACVFYFGALAFVMSVWRCPYICTYV